MAVVGRLFEARHSPGIDRGRLGHWPTWLAAAAAIGVLAWLFSRLALLPRNALAPAGMQRMYALGANIAVLTRLPWRSAFRSIRDRLFISFLLLVLFTGGTISYFSTSALMRQEQSDAVERLNTVAAHKQREIEGWANSLQTALALFAHSARPQLMTVLTPNAKQQASYPSAMEHLQADLMDTFLQIRLYDELYILDANRTVIVSAGSPGSIPPPLDVPCLRQALKVACLQPPHYYASLGRVAVVAAQPVVDAQGHTIGIVAGYAGLAALNTITAEADGLGDTGQIYLVEADHTVLAPLTSAIPDIAIRNPGIARALATQISGSGNYDNHRSVPVVGVYRWLPELLIALLAEQDQAEAFQSSRVLIHVHLGVTLILLVAAAAMALYIIRSITAPLGYLAATAERIADGAQDLTADIQHDDEIGTLARAFNHMTARLRLARDQLEQRTEELAQANAGLQAENAVRRRAEQVVQLERNKLRSILDAMEDGVYIVNQHYQIEYANPALEREFGARNGRKCYEYLYDRADVCPWCPNQQVWQGISVRWEQTLKDGKTHELFHTPLDNADGTLAKLAISHDVTARKQSQVEILQRNQELAILSRRLVEIQESERHYISRELHDETGQALTSLMLGLGMLERDLHRGVSVADRVIELKHTVEEVLADLHALAMELRPASLDHVGLVPALRQYVERMIERHGLVIDFGAIGLEEARLPPEMEITIYRIVQEALVNVVQHAQATHVDIIVERRLERVRVIIEDTGRGFDTEAAMYTGRLGLLGMRERAEMIGGHLMIDSAPGTGTTVVMEAPYGSHSDSG